MQLLQISFVNKLKVKKKLGKAKNNEQTVLGVLHPPSLISLQSSVINFVFFVFVPQGLEEVHSSWRRGQYSSFPFTYAFSRYYVTL